MQKGEIEKVIKKYRKLASSSLDEEKSHHYENFADYIEENIEHFEEDEYYENEEDLLSDFQEDDTEIDAQWESLFSEDDDEDDSITDYLTD